MRTEPLICGAGPVGYLDFNTVVVGGGAAGYAAAVRLWDLGVTDIAIVTDHVAAGTSRNAGSDKQTYYKLTLSGDEPDSVRAMASTLFDCGCTDGDNALCEAALSTPCFLRLCDLGVPFPMNAYGEYVGYKTDHDPCRRATSAGPYTSKIMTELLQKSTEKRGIPVFDGLQAIHVLKDQGDACGLLCLKLDGSGHIAFHCKNTILATGGPAGIYADSAYPVGHYGASSLAFEAGAAGQNLTEWQYGLASTSPRWNVSGTYMQALPRVFSCDADGKDEQEFLSNGFDRKGDMLTSLFLKGYQWPFDAGRAEKGSSMVDMLVYRERQRGRLVYLDYRQNPEGAPLDFTLLSDEAYAYLEQAGACFGAPIDRLLHMNAPAVSFYRAHGIDLAKEPLEIALCAQHCNGGVAVDRWWRTSVEGLFVCGEASGTHGVCRPGGSALNETQVGAARAAQYIAAHRRGAPERRSEFLCTAAQTAESCVSLEQATLGRRSNVSALWAAAGERMSRHAGAIRRQTELVDTLEQVTSALSNFWENAQVFGAEELWKLYRYRDALITQQLCLTAMADYAARGGGSRGGALYVDGDALSFSLDRGAGNAQIQEVRFICGECRVSWRDVRPIPDEDSFFENVWRAYRVTGGVEK